jgi:proline iminopeptidase
MATAYELHQAWSEAEFIVVADAGHAITDPGIKQAAVDAAERLKTTAKWD